MRSHYNDFYTSTNTKKESDDETLTKALAIGLFIDHRIHIPDHTGPVTCESGWRVDDRGDRQENRFNSSRIGEN